VFIAHSIVFYRMNCVDQQTVVCVFFFTNKMRELPKSPEIQRIPETISSLPLNGKFLSVSQNVINMFSKGICI
jgi:hypothetical protein